MPKYRIKNITNPVNVSEQEVEDFLQKYPDAVLIEEEQIEEEVDFPTSTVEDADAVQQPMTASQAENVALENTELPSVDTSLESPDPEPRFIEFKGKGNRPGAIVYEDTYLETKAGQPGYPNTFDEYAAAFNTTPQSSSTEEIVIKATSNEKVFENLGNITKGINYNKETGSFDSSLSNTELFNQEEEVSKKTFNKLFAGSGIDFEETDYAKEGEEGVILGTEALIAKVKNPETGKYIYSETLELESDGSFKNNDKIQKFLDDNKSYLDLPGWTRSKNKMVSEYKQWKNNELNPIINKARIEANQAYIINPDLFKPYDKKINVGGYNVSTPITETIHPYQKEIAQEVNRLERKGFKGNLEARAKINVRQNLKQADINEAIRETRAKFINASSNKEEAQAFLYASETFVKNEEAKAYNKNNEGTQISGERAKELQQKQQSAIKAYTTPINKNQSVDNYLIQQKNILQPIIDELNIEMPEDSKERINSPKLNVLLGLDEEAMLPKGFYNIMIALEDAKNANLQDYKNRSIEMTESISKISNIDIAMDATAKNYDLIEKNAVNAGLGLQDIAVNVGMLGLNILSLGQSKKVAKLGSDYVEYTKEIRDSYQRDVSFDEAFSSPGNTGKFVMQEISNQLPIFLAMAASGGSAAYVVGASSAGGKMMDMQNEIATGTAEYSPIKLWGTSLGYGVAEGAFAQLTTVPILRRAKLNWMNGGKESVVNNSMREYAKKQYTGLIYEPILEAAGEVATVGSQNLMDGNPFMQGMDHAGTSGLGFGFAFAAIPFLKGMYNSQFSTYETRGEIRKMQNELDGLQQELNMSLLNTPSSGTNFFKGKQDLLKQSIEEKSIQLADKIKQQEVIVANNLTEGGKNKVVDIINLQAELENKAIKVQENPNLSNKERVQLIAEIKSQYDFVVKQRNEAVKDETMLKNGTEWAAFKGLDRLKSQEYLDTADAILSGERNGKQASKEDINDRAYDLYFGDKIRIENKKLGRSNSSLFKNFKSFDTVDEAIKEVNNDDTIAAEDKKETIQALKNGNDGYWNPANSTMVAIVENQVKNQRKYTKTHEVGHKAFEMLLGNPKNNAAFKGISDQLLSTLKATDRKTYDKFIKDGIDDDAGNIDPTEVISRFMEYVADDQITNVQKAKGISGLFGVMIQKTFGSDYKFDFRGEQDIFNFVVGLGKKLKDGTLTTADIKKAKESKVIKDLPTSDTTTDADKKVSFSKAPLLDKINSLVPPSITTQEEYFSPKIFNEVFKATEEGGAISNYIKSKASSKEAGIKTIKSIQERLTNYDPAAERKKAGNKEPITFGEFIFSNTPFAIRDAKKALFKESEAAKKKADLDSKEVQGKTTEEDSGPTADTRKKYKPLISNPKLIPSFISSEIKTKLANVVSKLTSKLSTRPKGKNAQTTPLIAEIKKAIGNVVKDPKALPKQLIARMGNPKDGSYQTYLIDNKKSILENMTTTYLMSAIPQAVEKSVGGTYALDSDGKRKKDSNGNDIFKPKFVPYPEWVGKEIDREKVSTNKKGGTSGNQIVRRAIQKEVGGKFEDSITDEDFVANFVGSDGKVIRGKRESLGKALAEEAGFEVLTKELANEKSDIRKAFEGNQEALGEVLADNLVEQVTRDIERGTVKFSKGKYTPTQVQEVLSDLIKVAVQRGANSSEFEIIKNEYPEDIVKFGEELGLYSYFDEGKTGFKAPLKEFEVDEVFKKFFDKYFSTITNKNEETSMKQLADFSEAFIEVLPPEALAAFPDDMFGLVNGYLNAAENTNNPRPPGKYVWLARKKRTKQKTKSKGEVILPFDPQGVEIFNAGYGLMNQIATILNQEFPTAEAKRQAVIEKFGDRLDAANANNLAALDYLMQEATKIIAKNPSLIPGFLRWMESSTSNARAQRGLTTLDLIEYRAESQKVGKEHPLYNRALKFAKERAEISYNKKSKKFKSETSLSDFTKNYLANPRTGVESYLRFKGEHVTPAANVMVELAKNAVNAAASIIKNPIGEPQILTALSIKNTLDLANYSQTLGTKIFSDFQDVGSIAESIKGLGTTSKLGDFRGLALDSKDLNAFFSHDGVRAINYIQRKLISLESINKLYNKLDINKIVSIKTDQQAINNGNSIKFSKSPKKIRVFDFDDTLARTKSNVLYTMPDGSKGKIDAATFAKDAGKMEAEGAIFDFSEFSKVMDGKKGPLFEVAKKIADARGTEDVFVLTARPQDAAGPIQEFLKSLGLNIPIKNITGLADGNPKAKADWMIGKVAEGYNDFYFADDAIKNVKAVKDVFDTFDIKGKVQQAKIKFSKSLDKDFNEMIERNKGVAAVKEFSRIVAKRRGASVGKFKLWMPSSLDDFKGLTSYVFAGKGRQGDADQKFFQDALITPYFRGIDAIEKTRQTFKDDFKALNKTFKPVVSKLGKIIPDSDYTYDQAIRVALWTKAGYEIPGLSQRDQKKLNDFVNNDPELSAYIDGLTLISKRDKWSKPGSFWDTETILSDLNNLTEKVGRKEFLEEFIENSEIIFSEKNLNKIEAVYGTRQREALEDILYRMKNGTNRSFGMNKNENRWNNWVNNSIGAIMFFNRRSALLQTLSTVNFINWSDNNPAKAALAFANQSQYWKDFAMIFNSPKLKQRRAGLKSDVNEAEIASAVKGAKNKASAALSYLLKIGFTPTQMVDSFAIAAGGATFYRNRVNTLKKKGMSQADAETQAFQDFAQISEETQQSGDPALISSDQASSLGRLVLAFQNTPIQLNRSIKKAALDIYNRRRTPGQTQLQSDFSNMSKIIYYGTIQNILFTSLQNALFALLPGFDDEEPTEEERQELETTKASRIINGMVDTTLKGGFGLPGAVVSTIKNVIQEYYRQEEKGFTADQTYTIIQAINLSPPVGSKARKLYSAIQTQKFEADVIKKRGFDVTIDGKFNLSPSFKVLGSAAAAATNLPLDRVVDEVNSLTEALDTRNTQMQRIALALGWKTWDVGSENEENDLIKTTAKAKRKEEGRRKAKETRAKNKRAKRKPTYIKK